MPTRCVAGGCNSFPNLKEGIALHTIPFYNDDRPKARKRRKKWVNFVKRKRAKWEPTKTSAICSKHFKPEDFKRRFSFLPGQDSAFIPRLLTDDLGVSVFPTVRATSLVPEKPESDRAKRKVTSIALVLWLSKLTFSDSLTDFHD